MTKILNLTFLFFIFASGSIVQAASRTQMQDIKRAAFSVMIAGGAELELSPEVTKLKIKSETSEFALVEFQGVEFGPAWFHCTFTYSFKLKGAVPGTAKCL